VGVVKERVIYKTLIIIANKKKGPKKRIRKKYNKK